jgi:HEAT repeat protein
LAAILSASDNADPPSPHPEVGAGKPVPVPVGSVQVLAAGLLGDYPGAGSISVPVLVEALKGANERLTREVLLALGRIGDTAAIEPVLRCLESDEEQVRLAAIDALVGIGKGLESPVLNAALVRLLDDPGATVRDWAVRALADAGGEMAGLHLPRMLADEDRGVCRRAMAGLTPAMGGPQLSRQLQANLFRFSAGLRHEAAATLRRLNDSDSTTWLLDLLREDEQEAFHWICIDALGEIHATAVGAAAG